MPLLHKIPQPAVSEGIIPGAPAVRTSAEGFWVYGFSYREEPADPGKREIGPANSAGMGLYGFSYTRCRPNAGSGTGVLRPFLEIGGIQAVLLEIGPVPSGQCGSVPDIAPGGFQEVDQVGLFKGVPGLLERLDRPLRRFALHREDKSSVMTSRSLPGRAETFARR